MQRHTVTASDSTITKKSLSSTAFYGFDGFSVPFKERGARTNQSLEIIRRLLSGETVTFKSEFFDFKNIKVTPEPVQKPHPPVWLGGFTPAALRRAARYGDGFTVPGATRDEYDQYIDELKKQNQPTDYHAWAKGPTIVRVHEIGPFAFTYVDPGDDPRRCSERGLSPAADSHFE